MTFETGGSLPVGRKRLEAHSSEQRAAESLAVEQMPFQELPPCSSFVGGCKQALQQVVGQNHSSVEEPGRTGEQQVLADRMQERQVVEHMQEQQVADRTLEEVGRTRGQ